MIIWVLLSFIVYDVVILSISSCVVFQCKKYGSFAFVFCNDLYGFPFLFVLALNKEISNAPTSILPHENTGSSVKNRLSFKLELSSSSSSSSSSLTCHQPPYTMTQNKEDLKHWHGGGGGAVGHRFWSRAEKLLCLCSLGTHWKLYSDIFWDLVWSS
ncbi:Polymeric immunoglobulin receptor [Manis javanica]|nr:Polymeric immunoglobulin receptor [Manis javanica]